MSGQSLPIWDFEDVGDLICKGSVGARTGIDMKGGTIVIGGDAGAFTGFMMQRGRIVILGELGVQQYQ